MTVTTKPKPVPWEDVVDLQGDLFEWLVANGHARTNEMPLTAAVSVLAKADADNMSKAVAHAVVRIARYVAAGQREDFHQEMKANAEALGRLALLFDYSLEKETERDIRELLTGLTKIARSMHEVSKRKRERTATFQGAPLAPTDRARERGAFDAVLAKLSDAEQATKALLDSYQRINPAATEYRMTLSGWQQFEKSIREELRGFGFKWHE